MKTGGVENNAVWGIEDTSVLATQDMRVVDDVSCGRKNYAEERPGAKKGVRTDPGGRD